MRTFRENAKLSGRRGFALMATLWLLVALGAIGIEAALHAQARRQAAANVLDATRARAAASAGSEYARSRLTAAMLGQADQLRSQAQARGRAGGQAGAFPLNPRVFLAADPLQDPWRQPQDLVNAEGTLGVARYAMILRDLGAALDLNTADEDMLRGFFSLGLGIDYAQADHLAQAILDWRDADDIARINGGERDQYLKDGAPLLPTNRDFTDLDELRHVRGMTASLYARAAPYLTLVGSGQINLNSAPEPVLLALSGLDRGSVQRILELRRSGQLPRSDDQLVAMVPGVHLSQGQQRWAYTTAQVEVLVDGWVDGGKVRASQREVVTRGPAEAVVAWEQLR